jgi:RNA-directed DNA polymerase
MSNLLIRWWLKLWDQAVGRRYRHWPTEIQTDFNDLQRDVQRAHYDLQFWRFMQHRPEEEQEITLQLLNTETLAPYFQYRHFRKRKRDGSWRELAEPDPSLKKLQQHIVKRWLEYAEIHSSAVGFRRKYSIADHVWPHAGANFIITADIEDFFPSTTAYRVQQWWKSQFPFSDDAARLLRILTTYRDCLPQGAPTSPMLSNVINYEMDKRLNEKVRRSGGIYTRYADDMVFSWQGNKRPESDFERAVRAILREMGYRLHSEKGWKVYQRRDEPEITGVILSKHGDVRIPEAIARTIRELERRGNPDDHDRLAGYRAYRNMVENRPAPSPFASAFSRPEPTVSRPGPSFFSAFNRTRPQVDEDDDYDEDDYDDDDDDDYEDDEDDEDDDDDDEAPF